MHAKDYRLAARQKLTGKWTTVIIAFLIYTVIAAALSATGIGGIAVAILAGAFMVGLSAMMLKNSRGDEIQIEMVFDGFKNNIGNNIVAGILVYIYTFLWSLLFVIPGIVKSYSYAMTYYILVDHPEMSPSEAIEESKRMMDGNKWRLFCLDLSFIGWRILSIFTLGILNIWIYPYVQGAKTEFYESIRPKPEDTVIV